MLANEFHDGRYGFFLETLLEDIIGKDKNKQEEVFGKFRKTLYQPLVSLNLYLLKCLMKSGTYESVLDRYHSNFPLRKQKKMSGHNAALWRSVEKFVTLSVLEHCNEEVLKKTEQEYSGVGPFCGLNVLMIDGSTVKMLDTPENQEAFPQHGKQKQGEGFPISRISMMTNLESGAIMSFACAPYRGKGTGEISMFQDHMAHIEENDLILLDGYYDSYYCYLTLESKGAYYLTQHRGSRKFNFSKCGNYVYLKKPNKKPANMTEEEFQNAPEEIKTRICRGKTKKGKELIFLTNLPTNRFSSKDVFSFSIKRWNIEEDYREFKTFLESYFINVKTPKAFMREIATKILGYNIIKYSLSLTKKSQNIFFH